MNLRRRTKLSKWSLRVYAHVALQFRLPEYRAIHSPPLIVLFFDPKIWKLRRHYAAWLGAFDQCVFAEVRDTFMLS
jgi:hypothetical protein